MTAPAQQELTTRQLKIQIGEESPIRVTAVTIGEICGVLALDIKVRTLPFVTEDEFTTLQQISSCVVHIQINGNGCGLFSLMPCPQGEDLVLFCTQLHPRRD